ncbi:MAG: InlB B-repeat-containing protein [Candidatus Methanomethylophilaceae archaeon]|nr:InlB B-repeat-containing protein [Candidatus Methanomethylophilaceae archaeon]
MGKIRAAHGGEAPGKPLRVKIFVVMTIALLAVTALFAAGSASANDEPEDVIEVSDVYQLMDALRPQNSGKTVKLTGTDDGFRKNCANLNLYVVPGEPDWGMTIDLNGHRVNPLSTSPPTANIKEDTRFLRIGSGVSITIKDTSENRSAIVMNSMIWGDFPSETNIGGTIVNDGNLTIESGTFRNGRASLDGGGIYNDVHGVLNIKDTTFALNQAERNGGAIYNKGFVHIQNCSFAGNSAGEKGGAIYNEGTVIIDQTHMTMNRSKQYGGAIYNTPNAKLLVTGGEISNSESLAGSAVYNESNVVWNTESGSHWAADFTGTEFRNNTAYRDDSVTDMVTGCGGTVYNTADSNISLKDVLIKGSVAENEGGALYNQGTMSVTGSTIDGCSADSVEELRGHGGAIFNEGDWAVLTVRGTVISGNIAHYGAGICNMPTSSDLDSIGNHVTLETCTIRENETPDKPTYDGGGAYNTGVMDVTGTNFIKNVCYSGGGIYNEGRLVLNGSNFESNTANENGGAICIIGTVTADNVTMRNNVASKMDGGAICLHGVGTLDLGTCLITGNEALLYGGGIKVESGSVFNIRGTPNIYDNRAMLGKNVMLSDGETIGFSGPVDPSSKIDFAMQDPSKPFTDHFNTYPCLQSVFSYNEVSGFPFKEDLAETQLPELFCDYELWNSSKTGMTLISTWDELKSLANDSGTPNGTEVALTNSIYAEGRDCITVTRNIILDLNGYTIDRQLDDDHKDGQVFVIRAYTTMTIKDTIGTGTITGGYAKDGGAINIHDGSKLIFESGIIIGNRATQWGGAIYNNGDLEMTGGYVVCNTCEDDGGAIFCDDDDGCTMNLYNVVFFGNEVTDDDSSSNGGALHIDYRNSGTIQNCRFIDCVSHHGNGGAIFMEADDQMLYVIDCVFTGNYSGKHGGAICITDGGLEISGGKTVFMNNNSHDCGGAVYTDERKVVVRDGPVFHDNVADQHGGAFYTEGIIELMGTVDVSYNRAGVNGGAICIKDGSTVNIHSGVMLRYNHAGKNGGAIHNTDNGNLNLWGGTIEYNTADGIGGGIMMDEDADDIDIKGGPVVRYNEAVEGNGIYLESCRINVTGPLEKTASIYVTLDKQTGRFTNGYSEHNSDWDPSVFFDSAEGFLVALKDGEATFSAGTPGSATDGSNFIDWASQINDYYSLSDKNWMSGISGERRISEINIPGTHDSSMKKTESRFTASVGDFMHMHYMAKTQYLYINEQLNAGVRLFDIRVNNMHLVPSGSASIWDRLMAAEWGLLTWSDGTVYDLEDDGENLWTCHGKDKVGGTFYAMKSNGDDQSVDDVLNWMTNFLVMHPTETLIVEFAVETQDDDEDNIKISEERLYQKLYALSQQTNPSTGKSFIYIQDGLQFGDDFTEYPYLKDCRGQLVVFGDGIGGIQGENLPPVNAEYSQDVGFDCSIEEKRLSLERFIDQYIDGADGRYITPDVTEHLDVKYNIGFNVGPTDTMYYIGKYFESFVDKHIGPLYNADQLLPDFLAEGKAFDQRGKYVGWVKTDGAKAANFGYIWRSNFPDPLDESSPFKLNYADVRVESGLGAYPVTTYRQLLGSTFTIPGCIYEDKGDLEFVGWIAGETFYEPGSEYTVTGDVTFVAAWKDVNVVTVGFVNYDGTPLDTIHYVPGTSAADITAQAPVATREATAQYTYVFSGWEPAIADASENVTYTAKYDEVLNTYTVTWMTWDGLTLVERDEKVGYGSQPSYDGPAQTREETVQHTFEFIGWSDAIDSSDGKPVSDLPAVTGGATYYASFKKIAKQYTIRFADWDGTVLWEGLHYVETDPSVITPPDPVREPSGGMYYEFAGWSPTPVTVTADATYTATYNETDVQRYCITFMDWDAKIISRTWYEAGTGYADITVPEDPTRDPSPQFSYAFKGWSPSVPAAGEIAESVTFAAVYDRIVNKYAVKFYDWDGTELSSTDYDFGTPADSIVRPADPVRQKDAQYEYLFSGWAPGITDVSSDSSYMATYSRELRTFTITWKNFNGEILETDTDVQYGSIPVYDGSIPLKPQDVKDRFEFTSWDPQLTFVTQDATYTAQFEAIGLPFMITYVINGGEFAEGCPDKVPYAHGDRVLLYVETQVSRACYYFSGWHDNPELTGDWVSEVGIDDYGDKTFYMQWAPVNYDIFLNNAGGDCPSRITYNIETPTFTLDNPAIEGFTFIGWTNDDTTDPITMELTIEQGSSGTKRFTAHWEGVEYDIEYYDGQNKLTGIGPSRYAHEFEPPFPQKPTEIYLGPLPEKDGFVRVGWYTTSDFQEGTEISSFPATDMGVKKVYAKYEARSDVYWETLPAAVDGLVYDGDEKTLITAGTAVGGTAQYRSGDDGDFSTELPKATDAGEYRVWYKIVADNDDVDISWVLVTIVKPAPTVDVEPTAVTGLEYNGEMHELIIKGEASGGTMLYSLDTEVFRKYIPTGEAVGEYTVWYMIHGDNNHCDTEILGSVVVTIAKGSPETPFVPTANELTYNGQPQQLVGVDPSWNVVLQYSLDGTNYSPEIPTATDAGTHTVYYMVKDDPNYEDTEPATVDVTISKLSAEWVMEPLPMTLKYTTKAQPLLFSGIVSDSRALFRIGDTGDYSPEIPTASNPGTYVVWYRIDDANGNYEVPAEDSLTTVIKIPVHLTVSLEGWAYGQAPNQPAVTGNVGEAPVTFEYKPKSGGDSDYSANVPTDAGEYTVRATAADTAQFLKGSATADFAIAKATFTPTVSIDGWTRDQEPNAPTVDGNVSGGTVTFRYKEKGASDSTYSKAVLVDAGSYVVMAEISPTANYEGAAASAEFAIAKAAIAPSVTVEGWVYGETARVPTVTGNDGNGTVTFLFREQGAAEYSADVPTNAGNYELKAEIPETANYLGGSATTSFSISKASVTVTADDKSRVYGSADPKLTATVTWQTGGPAGTVSYTLSRATGEDVGAYVISVSAESNENYDVTVQPGTFSILKASITIDADDASKIYGSVDPELVAAVIWNTGGPVGPVPYALSRAAGEDVGAYGISVSAQSTSNYTVTSVSGGTLTISPRVAELIWNSVFTYDGKEHLPTASVGNLVEGDECTVTVLAIAQIHPGTYDADATSLSNGNYVLPDVTATKFVIDPKVAELIWNSVFTYDGKEHLPTASVGNIVEGDECTVTVLADAQINAGTYDAEATALGNGNYVLPDIAVTKFVIDPKVAALEWSRISFIYDGKPYAPTASVGNLVDGDVCSVTVSVDGEHTAAGEYTAVATALSNPNYALPADASVGYVIVGEDETIRAMSIWTALGVIALCVAMMVLGRLRK